MNLNPFTRENIRALLTVHPKSMGVVSPAQAKQVGNKLFVDWRKISPKDLAIGMNVELEHKGTLTKLGVKDTELLKAVALIALDHFSEDKAYYEKLRKVEGK